MITKTCIKCDVAKNINNFSFRKDSQNFRNCCKRCENERKNQLKKRKFENYEWKIQIQELECGTGKIVKPIECFSRRKYTELGVRKNSKDCKNSYNHEYYKENSETLKNYQHEYSKNNREKINNYYDERRKNDINFRIIVNTRTRIHHAFKGESKSPTSKEILGIDIETFKKWIEYQMTPEMNWSNIHIDHVRSISSFDVSNEDELFKAFNWKNTQPLLKEDNLRKGSKYNELDYQLQFIKAYEFLKLTGETTTTD